MIIRAESLPQSTRSCINNQISNLLPKVPYCLLFLSIHVMFSFFFSTWNTFTPFGFVPTSVCADETLIFLYFHTLVLMKLSFYYTSTLFALFRTRQTRPHKVYKEGCQGEKKVVRDNESSIMEMVGHGEILIRSGFFSPFLITESSKTP